ncbi:unnamed protein product [Amoebophrya sp. A120]|nr:unnamed protein product [Amoebophrya sp. A120]|eukprot:GSA120T00009055001.1
MTTPVTKFSVDPGVYFVTLYVEGLDFFEASPTELFATCLAQQQSSVGSLLQSPPSYQLRWRLVSDPAAGQEAVVPASGSCSAGTNCSDTAEVAPATAYSAPFSFATGLSSIHFLSVKTANEGTNEFPERFFPDQELELTLLLSTTNSKRTASLEVLQPEHQEQGQKQNDQQEAAASCSKPVAVGRIKLKELLKGNADDVDEEENSSTSEQAQYGNGNKVISSSNTSSLCSPPLLATSRLHTARRRRERTGNKLLHKNASLELFSFAGQEEEEEPQDSRSLSDALSRLEKDLNASMEKYNHAEDHLHPANMHAKEQRGKKESTAVDFLDGKLRCSYIPLFQKKSESSDGKNDEKLQLERTNTTDSADPEIAEATLFCAAQPRWQQRRDRSENPAVSSTSTKEVDVVAAVQRKLFQEQQEQQKDISLCHFISTTNVNDIQAQTVLQHLLGGTNKNHEDYNHSNFVTDSQQSLLLDELDIADDDDSKSSFASALGQSFDAGTILTRAQSGENYNAQSKNSMKQDLLPDLGTPIGHAASPFLLTTPFEDRALIESLDVNLMPALVVGEGSYRAGKKTQQFLFPNQISTPRNRGAGSTGSGASSQQKWLFEQQAQEQVLANVPRPHHAQHQSGKMRMRAVRMIGSSSSKNLSTASSFRRQFLLPRTQHLSIEQEKMLHRLKELQGRIAKHRRGGGKTDRATEEGATARHTSFLCGFPVVEQQILEVIETAIRYLREQEEEQEEKLGEGLVEKENCLKNRNYPHSHLQDLLSLQYAFRRTASQLQQASY